MNHSCNYALGLGGDTRIVCVVEDYVIACWGWDVMVGWEDVLIGWLAFGGGGRGCGGMVLFCEEFEGFWVAILVAFFNYVSLSFKKVPILLICYSSMLSILVNIWNLIVDHQ